MGKTQKAKLLIGFFDIESKNPFLKVLYEERDPGLPIFRSALFQNENLLSALKPAFLFKNSEFSKERSTPFLFGTVNPACHVVGSSFGSHSFARVSYGAMVPSPNLAKPRTRRQC